MVGSDCKSSASAIALSSASLVPEPMEKCAVAAASPSSTMLPWDQCSHSTRGKLSQAEPRMCLAFDISAMAAQLGRENPLADCDGLLLAHRAEAVIGPGLLAAFDDEGRGVGVELVGVRPDPAELGLLENEGEGVVEFLVRAEPDELAFAGIDVRLEMLGIGRAGARIQAVRRHDQIVLPRQSARRSSTSVWNRSATPSSRARACSSSEQLLAADAAEAVAGGNGLGALEIDGDVVPVGEMGADRLGARRIVAREIGQRLVRQDDAPAERVVRPVALEHDDLVRGIAQFHRDREIEPGRAAA